MKRKKTRTKGVITVLVALLLAGILSVGTLAIEAGRYQAAKTQLGDATISAATSMLAAYNSTLYDRYGLLAIDKKISTVGRCEDYLMYNSDLASGYEGNNISTLYLLDTVEMDGYYNLTYPSVLKRQMLSRAKYNLVINDFSFNYYNSDYFISSMQTKAKYVMDALQNVATGGASTGSMSDVPADMRDSLILMYEVFSKIKKYDSEYNVTLPSSSVALLPSVTGTVENNPPESDVELINGTVADAQTVLGSNGLILATNADATYSEQDVYVDVSYISNVLQKLSSADKIKSNSVNITADCYRLVQAVNAAMNVLTSDKDGNLLLNSYIAGYFPDKNNIVEGYNGPLKGTAVSGMSNMSFSGACAEYVFGASSSEVNNQTSAYEYIMALRLINNLYATIVDSNSFNRNSACNVASHVAWAYYESFADTELLFRYNAVVPMEKYSQIFPVNNPAKVKSSFATKSFATAMKQLGILVNDKFIIDGVDSTDYRDALAQSLWLIPNSKKMLRVADLIQLEMRYYQQYVQGVSVDFLMSEQDTYCRVKSVGKLNSILPVLSLGENTTINGISFQSIKYVGY